MHRGCRKGLCELCVGRLEESCALQEPELTLGRRREQARWMTKRNSTEDLEARHNRGRATHGKCYGVGIMGRSSLCSHVAFSAYSKLCLICMYFCLNQEKKDVHLKKNRGVWIFSHKQQKPLGVSMESSVFVEVVFGKDETAVLG